MAGGIVQTGAYKKGEGREEVQQELREGLQILIENDIDLIIVEVGLSYFYLIYFSQCETVSVFPLCRGDGVGPGAGSQLWQACGGDDVYWTHWRWEGGAE